MTRQRDSFWRSTTHPYWLMAAMNAFAELDHEVDKETIEMALSRIEIGLRRYFQVGVRARAQYPSHMRPFAGPRRSARGAAFASLSMQWPLL